MREKEQGDRKSVMVSRDVHRVFEQTLGARSITGAADNLLRWISRLDPDARGILYDRDFSPEAEVAVLKIALARAERDLERDRAFAEGPHLAKQQNRDHRDMVLNAAEKLGVTPEAVLAAAMRLGMPLAVKEIEKENGGGDAGGAGGKRKPKGK